MKKIIIKVLRRLRCELICLYMMYKTDRIRDGQYFDAHNYKIIKNNVPLEVYQERCKDGGKTLFYLERLKVRRNLKII